MPVLVEIALAVVCALLIAGPGYVVGKRQLEHRRHSATLANIARLERELGYDEPFDVRFERELGPPEQPPQPHVGQPFTPAQFGKRNWKRNQRRSIEDAFDPPRWTP